MRTLILSLVIITIGCGDDDRQVTDARVPDVINSDVGCEPDLVSTGLPRENVSTVDLLLAIDNSGSMGQEQATLATNLPDFITTLASRGVRDLRVGVVSSDMGTGGFTIPTCSEPNFGDDGILSPQVMGAGCTAIPSGEPPFLGFRPAEGGSAAGFASEVACIANLGTQGCGFEQQLDALLKAVVPESSPITFVNGSRGHGSTNQDFLREESILAVLVLTDEDDCSASDPDIFNRNSTVYTDPDLNLRCPRYEEALHPISRYVGGLLSLRAPERLVYMAITGVPVDLAPAASEAHDWDLLIGDESVRDPRLIERPDPVMPSQLTPSCDVPGRGAAYPPVRIAGVARGIEEAGGFGGVQSICQDDFGGALDIFATQIISATLASCLARPLDRAAGCEVIETLVSGDCENPGRVPAGVDSMGRTQCKLCEADAFGDLIDTDPACQVLGSAAWFYNEEAAACPASRPQRIDFVSPPASDSQVALVCPDPTSCP